MYAEAQRLRIPVLIHTGGEDSPGLVKYCNPIYLDDVAKAFPDLKIIMGIAKELKIDYNKLFEPFLEEYPENKEFQDLYKKFDLIKDDPASFEILKKLLEILDVWTEEIEKRRA